MYKPTIGLEIHVQLKTKSKMFCGCDNDAEGKVPNTVVCPICMGMPGVLPVPNKQAIEWMVKLGRYLNGTIASFSKFDRKHYFYPDLPKGYQISQYDLPIVSGGYVMVEDRKIQLRRIHLEEDTGKLLHPEEKKYSLVDLNRAGTPLLEIVTEPMIETPKEAKKFGETLQVILRFLEISGADMEKGEMRVEANISLRKIADRRGFGTRTDADIFQRESASSQRQSATLGTKVEIKNLNSFKAVEAALEYEIKRQTQILEKRGKITQATVGYDEEKGKTFLQRVKEEAQDYRYFPEPDIPPLVGLNKWKVILPEGLTSKRNKLVKLGVAEKDLEVIFRDVLLIKKADELLTSDKALQKFSKGAVRLLINFKIASKIDGTTLLKISALLEKSQISPAKLSSLLKFICEKSVSLEAALKTEDFSPLIEKALLEKTAKKIIDQNSQAVLDYKKGKIQALEYLLGKLMGETRGKAVPRIARQILEKLLK